MAMVAEAIDVIRAFVSSPAAQPDETIRLAAESYREQYGSIVARMRQCLFYLDRERVAEAVHLAQQAPPLLQAWMDLDFPERAQWAEQADLNSLPMPMGAISDNDIQRLNQAFLREEGTRELLSAYRKASLAMAPVSKRIGILRDLCRADPLVSGWVDDLKQLETKRQQELGDVLLAALDRRDPEELSALAAELRPENWLVKPPPNWLESLLQAKDDLQEEKAQAEYARLSGGLEAAFAANSHESGFMLLREWNALEAGGRMPNPDAGRRAAPALNWLRIENERRSREAALAQAVAGLKSALNANRPAAALQSLLAKAEQIGKVKPDLSAAVHKRCRDEARKAGFRRLLKIAACLSVLSALSATGYLGWRRLEQRKAVAALVSRIEAALKDDSVEGAQKVLAAGVGEKPELADADEIIRWRGELDRQLAADTERRKQLAAIRGEIINSGHLESVLDTDSLVAAARPLVRTATEKSDLEVIELQARSARQEGNKQWLSHYNRWDGEIRAAARDMSGASAAELEKLAGSLARLVEEIANYEVPKYVQTAVANQAALLASVKELSEKCVAGRQGRENLDRSWQSLAAGFSFDGLQAIIQEMSSRHPDLFAANNMKLVADTLPRLRQAMAFAEFEDILRKWLQNDMDAAFLFPQTYGELKGGTARQALSSLNQWRDKASSGARDFDRNGKDLEYLEQAFQWAVRLDELYRPESPYASVREAFRRAAPILMNVWEVRVGGRSSGAGFLYSTENPDPSVETVRVVGQDGHVRDVSFTQTRLAPHAAFATKLLALEEQYPSGKWPFTFYEAMKECLAANMDPFPKVELSAWLLELAVPATPEPFKKALSNVRSRLNHVMRTSGIEETWMRADNSRVVEAKLKLGRDFDEYRVLMTNLINEYLASLNALKTNFPKERRLVGILGNFDRNANRYPILFLVNRELQPSGSLFLYNAKARFVPVPGGAAAGDIASAPDIGAGTTVWHVP